MWKKFIHGLIFGSGAAIAFIAIWVAAIYYVFPAVAVDLNNKASGLSGGREAEVVPSAEGDVPKREVELFKGRAREREIPTGGGMLSVSVLPRNSGFSRPSTFQAWVTENEAFIIQTEGEIPTIKQMPYRERESVDYASSLVQDNFGFVKQNGTFPVEQSEIESLIKGQQPGRARLYNGEFRITQEGIVFLLPNEYEHNK